MYSNFCLSQIISKYLLDEIFDDLDTFVKAFAVFFKSVYTLLGSIQEHNNSVNHNIPIDINSITEKNCGIKKIKK